MTRARRIGWMSVWMLGLLATTAAGQEQDEVGALRAERDNLDAQNQMLREQNEMLREQNMVLERRLDEVLERLAEVERGEPGPGPFVAPPEPRIIEPEPDPDFAHEAEIERRLGELEAQLREDGAPQEVIEELLLQEEMRLREEQQPREEPGLMDQLAEGAKGLARGAEKLVKRAGRWLDELFEGRRDGPPFGPGPEPFEPAQLPLGPWEGRMIGDGEEGAISHLRLDLDTFFHEGPPPAGETRGSGTLTRETDQGPVEESFRVAGTFFADGSLTLRLIFEDERVLVLEAGGFQPVIEGRWFRPDEGASGSFRLARPGNDDPKEGRGPGTPWGAPERGGPSEEDVPADEGRRGRPGLPDLTSSLDVPGTERFPGGPRKVPFIKQTQFWGYVGPNDPPNAKEEDIGGGEKSCFYLYFWVPAVLDELGVRMISPIGRLGEPAKGDFVTEGFKVNPDDTDWFDPWLRVDQMSALTVDAIGDDMTVLMTLGEDDDGDDTFDETRHTRYNSLLRVRASDLTHLTRGCYRITFTTGKVGAVKGSFVVTVGTHLPGDFGVTIARIPAALKKALADEGRGGATPGPAVIPSSPPRWFFEPQIDGNGLYAAGVSEEVKNLSLATRNAEADARVRLASIAETKVQSVFRRYLMDARGELTETDAKRIKSVARVVVDTTLHNARKVKVEPGDQGKWFVLICLRYDDLSAAIRKTATERIAEVADDPTAYQTLDRLLKDELAP